MQVGVLSAARRRSSVIIPGFVGGKTATWTTSPTSIDLTGLTGGLASSPQQGDFVLLLLGVAGTSSATPPALTSDPGFTSMFSTLTSPDSDQSWLSLRYLVVGSGTLPTFTPASTGSTNWNGAAVIMVFRGYTWDGSSATNTLFNRPWPDPSAITPSVAGSWIVAAGVAGQGVFNDDFTTPSDLTNFTHTHLMQVAGTPGVIAGVGLKTDWTSGSFDPAQWTTPSWDFTNSACAATICLRPSLAFTSAPTIASNNGFVGQGDTFTATAGASNGTHSGWQWYRDGSAISGATSSTYTTVSGDLGALITVKETVTDYLSNTLTSAASNALGPIVTPTYGNITRKTSDGANRKTSDGADRNTYQRTA